MDEFRKLPWSWKAHASDIELERSYHLNMKEEAESNAQDILFSQLLSLDPVHAAEYNQIKQQFEPNADASNAVNHVFVDARTKKPVADLICENQDIDIAKRNILLNNFVRMSLLSSKQYAACFRVVAGEAADENDENIFAETEVNRVKEREQFDSFVRRTIGKMYAQRFHFVRPAINQFYETKWKFDFLKTVEANSSKKFTLKSSILIDRSSVKIDVKLIHEQKFGKIAELPENVLYLRQSVDNLMENYRQEVEFTERSSQKFEEIAKEHDVDVILPLATIQNLLLLGKRAWNSDLVIEEKCGSETKFLHFKGSFPEAHLLTGYERSRIGGKHLLKSSVLSSHRSFNCENGKICDKFNESEIEIDGSQNAPNYGLVEVDASKSKDFSCHFNVAIRISELKSEDKYRKLLIWTSQNAFRAIEENGAVKFINLSSKIEHQAEYGAEMMAVDELITEWCDLFFCPDTETIRYRHDVESGQVIQVSSISLENVENDLKNIYNINREDLLRVLWFAIETFERFPNGEYILSHRRKESDDRLVHIYQNESEGKNSIRSFFDTNKTNYRLQDDMKYFHIDDRELTEIHKRFRLLPCAFPPKTFYEENQIQSTPKRQQARKVINANKKEIKPKDDSDQVAQRAEKYQKAIKQRQQFISNLKKTRKRKKRQEKLKAKAQVKVEKAEENKEMESLKELFSADQPETKDTENFKTPRLTRKRAIGQCSNTNDTESIQKNVDITKAHEEISKRRVTRSPSEKTHGMTTRSRTSISK